MKHYRPGAPLTPEGLFQLVTEEFLRDGVLEEVEQKILRTLVGFLDLDSKWASSVLAESRREYQAGTLGTPRRFHSRKLYAQILSFTAGDGKVSQEEARLLAAMKRLFKIENAEHDEIFRRVRLRFRRSRDPDPSHLEAPPEPEPASPPSAPETQLSFRAFELAKEALECEAPLDLLPKAQEILSEIQAELRSSRASPSPLCLQALGRLAHPFFRAQHPKPWVDTLVELREVDPWREAPESFRRLLEDWSLEAFDEDRPERVRGWVAWLLAFTKLRGPSEDRWRDFARALSLALKFLASHRHWELHHEVFSSWSAIPAEEYSRVAADRAEAISDWILLGLNAGQHFCVERAWTSLKLLHPDMDQEAVRHHLAPAWTCTMEVALQDPRDRSLLEPSLAPYLSLLESYPEDREIFSHFLLLADRLARTLAEEGSFELLARMHQVLITGSKSLDRIGRRDWARGLSESIQGIRLRSPDPAQLERARPHLLQIQEAARALATQLGPAEAEARRILETLGPYLEGLLN